MAEGLETIKRSLREIEGKGDSTELVDLLVRYARKTVNYSPREAIERAEQAAEMARRLSYRQGLAYAVAYAGHGYYLLANHEAALPRLTEALPIIEELNDTDGLALTLGALAMVHRSLGEFEQALSYGFRSLSLHRKNGNREGEAWTLNGIGGGYHDLGDYKRSLGFHQKALGIFTELGSELGQARALTGIGTVRFSQGELDDALSCQLKALDIFQRIGNKPGESRALDDLGTIYRRQQKFDQAQECHEKSLALRQEIGNKQAQSTSLINLGELSLARKDPDQALEFLHRALSLAMETQARLRILQANRSLSEAYEMKGEFEEALAHYKEFHRVKELVLGDEASARVRNLQIRFEVEKSEREAEIERLRNIELKETNEKLEKLLDELRRTQNQLIQSEKMASLGSLVAGIVHELNSPIGTSRSAADVSNRTVDLILKLINAEDDPGVDKDRVRQLLEVMSENNKLVIAAVNRISKIAESLKTFSRLDHATYQKYDLHEGIDSALSLLQGEMGGRIAVERQYGELPEVVCYPGEINQLFMHLLSNAIHAIEDTGTITIRTERLDDQVRLQFIDDGVGIEKQRLAKLFEPGFSRQGPRVKAGFGLFTSHNIVNKHGGTITADSSSGQGSTFTVELPIAGIKASKRTE